MGELGTMGAAAGRLDMRTCCNFCGAWYATVGDDGHGAWIYHDEKLLAFATHCKPCTLAQVLGRPAGMSLLDRDGAAELYRDAMLKAEQRDLPATSAVPARQQAASAQDAVTAHPEPSKAQTAPERARRRRSDVRR